MPGLVIGSYDEAGNPDAMTAAWGSIADMNQIAIYISPGHKSMKNILQKKAFTVSMADAVHFVEADTLINLLQEHGNAAVYIDLELPTS